MISTRERQALNAFRELYPNASVFYTWFSYRKGAREHNIGWRIDCIYASPALAARVKPGIIYTDETSSDHYPLTIEFAEP